MRALLLSLALLTAVAALADGPWRHAEPGHAWSFPDDHHAMPDYRNEWWYVTGQLAAEGADAPTHGFQVTLFRLGLMPDRPAWDSDWSARDLVLGHAAVTDLRTGEHLFSEVLTRPGPDRGGFGAPGDSVLAWCRAPAGTAGRWSVRMHGDDGFAVTARDASSGLLVDLALTPERPRIFQGPGGFSAKDPDAGAGSLYYSYTRLAARGAVSAGGDTLRATGRAWLDREVFTSQLADRHVGWDWLSLQLADGRDVMVFTLRDEAGAVDVAHATEVDADGDVRWITAPLDVLTPVRWWGSPRSQARYPVSWRLRLPGAGIDVELRALVDDQENAGPRTGIVYWEGAVVARDEAGREAGRGYVEMTGYGSTGRPALR